jgi:hypothetical protein
LRSKEKEKDRDKEIDNYYNILYTENLKMNYCKLLKSKRWSAKRAIILKRDNYTCAICKSNEKLCVHHTYYYLPPIEPWKYPDDCYMTLCEDCHNKWHRENEKVYIYNPNKSTKAKPNISPPKNQRWRKKRKGMNPFHSKGGLSLAEIQQNREAFVKLKDGTWVRKRSIRQNNK